MFHPDWLCPDKGRVVRLRPFLIDEAEVSNAQYAAFLKATDRQPPATWPKGDFDAAWNELPAVGMSQREAMAYAEWLGVVDYIRKPFAMDKLVDAVQRLLA